MQMTQETTNVLQRHLTSGDNNSQRKLNSKSRWSDNKSFVPGSGEYLVVRADNRSPSSEPAYDAHAYKPPSDYRNPQVRLSDKAYILHDDHPEINFVGLLIGPCGNTSKATGAKIIIRGKLFRRDGSLPGENEQLHLYECMNLINATALVCVACGGYGHIGKDCKNPLAGGVVVDEKYQALMNQLNEISSDPAYSSAICECMNLTNTTALVCVACGGYGHIGKDCKNPLAGGVVVDEKYQALMNQLNEISSDPAYSSAMYRGAQFSKFQPTIDLNERRYPKQSPTSGYY
uniref:Branchpoint-bridging protein n=1 Tax=Rhabditophanes sp. KR3021 TaxID=114890 RepID=A0AC35U1E3_9BILA